MERPKSISVFGVLNIVFGVLGLCGILFGTLVQFGLANPQGTSNPVLIIIQSNALLKLWMQVGLVLGFVATIALIASGIGLLQTRPWARVTSVWYAIYSIGSVFIGTIMNVLFVFGPLLEQVQNSQGPAAAGAVGGLIGGTLGPCIGLIYPVVLLIFMTRPWMVAAFDPTQNFAVATPIDHRATFSTTPPPLSPASGNPYASPAAIGSPMSLETGSSADDAVATIIPYRNAPALIAYYLGVFSISACIPFLGIIGLGMAIAAFICGINGLKRAREHPEAHGRVHAWIGIIGGAICTIFGLLINVSVIIAVVAGNLR